MPDEKRIVQCSGCAMQYNVAKLAPGTQFKCQKCGAINTVTPPPAPEPIALEPEPEPEPEPAVEESQPSPATDKVRAMPRSRLGGTGRIPPRGTSKFKQPAMRRTSMDESGGEDEGLDGIRIKKKSSTPLILGIVGGVAALIIIILVATSGNKNVSQYSDDDTTSEETTKTEKQGSKSGDKTETKPSENKEVHKPIDLSEPPPAPKEEVQTPKKKPKFAVKEEVKAEIMPILEDIAKTDNTKRFDEIKGKGADAIPVLIEAIGFEDAANEDFASQIARRASEILISITKRADAPNINPMLSSSQRKDYSEDWKDWWKENQDKFK